MYDVEKDEFVPFINDYTEINNKFIIHHVERYNTSNYNNLSYVIDNDNHILYWLHTISSQNSLISLDVKDLKNIKLINQTLLPSSIDHNNNNICFAKGEYTMLLVGNTIQFILVNDFDY